MRQRHASHHTVIHTHKTVSVQDDRKRDRMCSTIGSHSKTCDLGLHKQFLYCVISVMYERKETVQAVSIAHAFCRY
jgi:hypothetical protein